MPPKDLAFIAAGLLLAGCAVDGTAPAGSDISRVSHVVVIYLENRSFDNLYGEFPGSEGLGSPSAVRFPQLDPSGVPYVTLPQLAGSPIPSTLPNRPFRIDLYVPAGEPTADLVHRYYQEQAQINGGRMDRFVAVSDAEGLTLGYYPTAQLPLAREAAQYTLCDNFFHGAFGGSFINHIFLVAAAPAVFPDAPAAAIVQLDGQGHLVRDGSVSPDGFVVNTMFSVNTPHPGGVPPASLVPSQAMPTIGDRLSDKGVDWAWYAGGWDDALAGHPAASFQFHHQPFTYFARYADGQPDRSAHLKDERDFLAAATAGTLPAVSFVKPLGIDTEHPGYTDLLTGETHVEELINAVRSGPDWEDVAIIVTYDENGGFWDHVAPPVIDRWGPGTRVPAIIVSPFARRGFVDHTYYDTASILAFIERRWALPPLGTRDARANDLTAAFDFGQRGM